MSSVILCSIKEPLRAKTVWWFLCSKGDDRGGLPIARFAVLKSIKSLGRSFAFVFF